MKNVGVKIYTVSEFINTGLRAYGVPKAIGVLFFNLTQYCVPEDSTSENNTLCHLFIPFTTIGDFVIYKYIYMYKYMYILLPRWPQYEELVNKTDCSGILEREHSCERLRRSGTTTEYFSFDHIIIS